MENSFSYREHIKDDIEKAPPPVVPILELGLSKGVQITVHDPETYLKDHVKYSHEVTEWLRVISRIDYPTPPAYSASGRYAILTSRFSDIRHGWYQTFVLEKTKDVWTIILSSSSRWGRAD